MSKPKSSLSDRSVSGSTGPTVVPSFDVERRELTAIVESIEAAGFEVRYLGAGKQNKSVMWAINKPDRITGYNPRTVVDRDQLLALAQYAMRVDLANAILALADKRNRSQERSAVTY